MKQFTDFCQDAVRTGVSFYIVVSATLINVISSDVMSVAFINSEIEGLLCFGRPDMVHATLSLFLSVSSYVC